MAARKSTPRKIRLMKKQKQTSPVPTWVIVKTKRGVRTYPKRRAWRQTDVDGPQCFQTAGQDRILKSYSCIKAL